MFYKNIKNKTLKIKTNSNYKKISNTMSPNVKLNDVGYYYSRYRRLFWSEKYPVSTHSSLSTSLEFNSSIEKHFYVLNNLEELISKEDFFFPDFFEKIEYSCNSHAFDDNNLFTDSLMSNKYKESNLINYLRKNIIYKTNDTLNNYLNRYHVLKQLDINFSHMTLWKLMYNFIGKNVLLTNFLITKSLTVDKTDSLNVNLEFDEAEDYVFRLYDDYNSNDLAQNAASLFSKFTSDYETKKSVIEIDEPVDIELESTHFSSTESNLNSSFVYSNYFDNSLIDELKYVFTENYKIYRIKKQQQRVVRKKNSFKIINSSLFYDVYEPQLKKLRVYSHKDLLYGRFTRKSYFTFIFNTVIFNSNIKFNLFKNPLKTENVNLSFNDRFYNTIFPHTNFYYKKYVVEIDLENFSDVSPSYDKPDEYTDETSCSLFSISGSSFIIQHIGLFLHFKLFWFSPKFENFKFKLKKKIFSFYKTNEIKQTIMEHRKSLYIFRYIDSRNWSWDKRSDHDYSNYNLNLDFYLKKKLELKSLSSLSFFKSQYINNLVGYDRSTMDISYTDSLKKFTLDPKYRQIEFRIPRIKFNPGYQRLWREYRLALADAIRFKYIYQKQLTRYLAKFYECIKSYNILALEYKVWKIIIYSRLLPDLHSIQDFMSNSLIFLNGKTLKNENLIIAVNDIVQLQVSVWYYIYYKWLTSWNNTRIKKFKKLVYRKKIASSYTIIKSLKQKSRYTPLYVYNMRFDMSDTKSYLEIDYLTLSFIFIYDNFKLDMSSPDDFIEMRHYVYRMYNWKYIN